MRNKLFFAYLVTLLLGVILLLTGYSFSLKLLNILLIGIIVAYPVIRFYNSTLTVSAKLGISFGALAVLSIAGYGWLFIVAFSSGKSTTIKEWHPEGYRVVLTKRLDWAGPPYYKYDLVRTRFFGLLEKQLAFAYPGPDPDSSCTIEFSQGLSSNHLTIWFDKCLNSVTSVQQETSN